MSNISEAGLLAQILRTAQDDVWEKGSAIPQSTITIQTSTLNT
ncbi:MAG: hypothetical protein AAF564_23500 [Bacteroidota bacterium]